MASSAFYKSMKRTRNDDLDSDSDSELYVTSDTWPRFIVMTSGSEEKPLCKLSPFAVQKGVQHQEAERRILPRRVLQKSPG